MNTFVLSRRDEGEAKRAPAAAEEAAAATAANVDTVNVSAAAAAATETTGLLAPLPSRFRRNHHPQEDTNSEDDENDSSSSTRCSQRQQQQQQQQHDRSYRRGGGANETASAGGTAAAAAKRRRRRGDGESFQTKFAVVLTAVSLLLLVILSAITSSSSSSSSPSSSFAYDGNSRVNYNYDSSSSSSSSATAATLVSATQQQRRRHLQQEEQEQDQQDGGGGGGDNGDNGDETADYSAYSCHYIYDQTPDPGAEQCRFARTCNRGDGVWAPAVFCYNGAVFSTAALTAIIAPFAVVWMVLLFRMLGSTAEDYFSPALEMFSVKLGLPPRFAGVSLLALGNGAADVSATVAAVTGDAENGYKLSLGALTGAAMVIGGVVSALVVLVAGGVPCRGALVRDVTALLVAVLVVWKELSAGQVTAETVTLFLSLYGAFVVLVLVADVYHRAVVIPRQAEEAAEAERARQLEEQRLAEAAFDDDDIDLLTSGGAGGSGADGGGASAAAAGAGAGAGAGASGGLEISGVSDSPGGQQQQQQASGPAAAAAAPPRSRMSRFSKMITALSNYDNVAVNGGGSAAGGAAAAAAATEGWGVESDDLAADRPIMLHGQHGILTGDGHLPTTPAGGAGGTANEAGSGGDGSGNYSMLEDEMMAGPCAEPGSANSVASAGWRSAAREGAAEIRQHWQETWDDIVWNGDVGAVSKFLLLCELPFTALRKATVPIPCEGYYVRAVVAASLALSPAWTAHYLWDQHDIRVFAAGSRAAYASFWLLSCAAAAAVLRYAPAGRGDMALQLQAPIALYGFCIAATWIDQIADKLVGLLNFAGIVLRVPGAVIGLTVLAWGNSMGDLSANLTMARKGLANMAMTACFAGPVFNILVGLGLGFGALAAQTGIHERDVELAPSVATGFLFVALNSAAILATGLVFGNGRIPVNYGYIALTLYAVYLVTGITLQYSGKYNDDNE